MKRESHVPPLFKRSIGGGRATSATVSPFTHSSTPGEPVDDHADATSLAVEIQFARRTESRKRTRDFKRTSVSAAANNCHKTCCQTACPAGWRGLKIDQQ
jgi:CO dehydrogenase/acetyl-CoA synthase alpha subunit